MPEELIVQGFGAEAYVAAMADVYPVPAWQPFRRIARDITVRVCCEEIADPIVGSMIGADIAGDSQLAQQDTEEYLRDEVYGALPAMLIFLWPILQPLVMAVIRKLIAYWRNRPEAVQAIQAAARAGS